VGICNAAQTSNRSEKKEEVYYFVVPDRYRIGRKTAQWLDAASYNKGWNDELMTWQYFLIILRRTRIYLF